METEIKKLQTCFDLSGKVAQEGSKEIIQRQLLINDLAIMQALIKILEELNKPQ